MGNLNTIAPKQVSETQWKECLVPNCCMYVYVIIPLLLVGLGDDAEGGAVDLIDACGCAGDATFSPDSIPINTQNRCI